MFYYPNTMRYLLSLLGASADDLVTAETPAGFTKVFINKGFISNIELKYELFAR